LCPPPCITNRLRQPSTSLSQQVRRIIPPVPASQAAMSLTPEQKARVAIDRALTGAGWVIQSRDSVNLSAATGVAIREFTLQKGYGTADYLLFVDGAAAGALEAKKPGETLTGVEVQTERCSEGLPKEIPAHRRPLPFLYQSTGVETRFTNRLDPAPRSRPVFHIHRPEMLGGWLADAPLNLRRQLQGLPQIDAKSLWPAQLRAESSRPRRDSRRNRGGSPRRPRPIRRNLNRSRPKRMHAPARKL